MNKHAILLLQIASDEYEQIVLDLYFNWCLSKSENNKTLQKLLICKPLFNWWQRELSSFEAKFIDEALPYANSMTPSAALDFYHSTTKEIFKLFSKPLINKALSI